MDFRLPDGTTALQVEDPSGNLQVFTRAPGPLPPSPVPGLGTVAWYVPYARVHPATVQGAPKSATWVDVSSSNIAYYAMLLQICARGESFALLEHDVVCRPDVIAEFEECPEPWCVYVYSDLCCDGCREAWRNHLGCTRFREELIAAVPDAMSSIPPDNWDWHEMCNGLGENLRAGGFAHHWHGPAVQHKQHIDLETWLK